MALNLLKIVSILYVADHCMDFEDIFHHSRVNVPVPQEALRLCEFSFKHIYSMKPMFLLITCKVHMQSERLVRLISFALRNLH